MKLICVMVANQNNTLPSKHTTELQDRKKGGLNIN